MLAVTAFDALDLFVPSAAVKLGNERLNALPFDLALEGRKASTASSMPHKSDRPSGRRGDAKG